MFPYKIQQLRLADLIREAAAYRLAREAGRATRAAREDARASAGQESEGREDVRPPHRHGPRRHRQTRTA